MGPSQRQLRLLSPEDRIIYMKWLRRSLMLYSTALALLVMAMVANHFFASASSEVAEDSMHTAAIASGK
ncbi:MAG TPA: hypothetical protein VFL62_22930 [Bradyrhizobium sp.]|uniref:hypothetical protein n=1 Tax=Bradyrhizobium sp. TaxID=376 RepID=UPI002D7FEE72|nr:hypothetical protein [Bradyrhizobium sp.]HET7889093.1 hypothetical protein [Bradyrhizobium sp.]